MEEKKNRRCCTCHFFRRYYTKGYCHFSKEEVGYCRKKEGITDKNETCEEWRSNYVYTRHRGKVALRAINEILLNLNEIRQIIEEDKEIEKDQTKVKKQPPGEGALRRVVYYIVGLL